MKAGAIHTIVMLLDVSSYCGVSVVVPAKLATANFRQKKSLNNQGSAINMAEEVRFELTEGCPSAVFKTAAFSHSATPPSCGGDSTV